MVEGFGFGVYGPGSTSKATGREIINSYSAPRIVPGMATNPLDVRGIRLTLGMLLIRVYLIAGVSAVAEGGGLSGREEVANRLREHRILRHRHRVNRSHPATLAS